jgi:hypothetical protein
MPTKGEFSMLIDTLVLLKRQPRKRTKATGSVYLPIRSVSLLAFIRYFKFANFFPIYFVK